MRCASAVQASRLRNADFGLQIEKTRALFSSIRNPKSAFRNCHGAGQFLATLYPAASASSTVLNLT
jgi:hypothetical protein